LLGEFGLSQRGGFVTVLGEKFIPAFKTSSEIIRLAVMMYVRFPLSLPQSLTNWANAGFKKSQ